MRESVLSYLKNRYPEKLVDTPTRIINASNDFLPVKSTDLALKTGKDQELLTPRREFKALKQKLKALVDKQTN